MENNAKANHLLIFRRSVNEISSEAVFFQDTHRTLSCFALNCCIYFPSQDENDFSPVFDKSSYNASIMENSKIGSIVVDLNATDLDSGLNSKITYLIISGNDQNAFAISVSNGEIRTQDILDRERKDSYLLTVRLSFSRTFPISSIGIPYRISRLVEKLSFCTWYVGVQCRCEVMP